MATSTDAVCLQYNALGTESNGKINFTWIWKQLYILYYKVYLCKLHVYYNVKHTVCFCGNIHAFDFHVGGQAVRGGEGAGRVPGKAQRR